MTRRKISVLFYLFLASTLFLTSFVAFTQPVYAQAPTYTYDGATVTITGITANLAGWYSADVAGGWNTIHRSSVWQYWLDSANLADVHIGDGSTSTLFYDNVRQLDMASVPFYVYNNAILRIGTLSNPLYKRTTNGMEIVRCSQLIGYEGSRIELFDSRFGGGQFIFNGTDNKIWRCIFGGSQIQIRNTNVYNVIINNGYFTAVLDTTVPFQNNTIDGIYQWSGFLIYVTLDVSASLSNVETIASSCLVITFPLVGYEWSGQLNFTDVVSTYPLMGWQISYQNPSDTGVVWRKYTFGLNTTANSKVEIWYDGQGGGTVYNDTISGTQLSTQTLIKGFYNITGQAGGGGNVIYSYEPYHLRISKEGYQTYESTFSIGNKTRWRIDLQSAVSGGAGGFAGGFFMSLLLGIFILFPIGIVLAVVFLRKG